MSTLIDGIVAWNRGAHRNFELFLGEFGSYGKYARPIDRKAWTSFVVQEAEKRGMSWAYWEYSQGFGAWDPDAGRWRDEITSALIPQ
uniref:Cellulase n=1 Tax=Gracilinema caldarium TaxID=215591 RepID=A0A7C3EBH1_9SPIR